MWPPEDFRVAEWARRPSALADRRQAGTLALWMLDPFMHKWMTQTKRMMEAYRVGVMQEWRVRSFEVDEVVVASDQWAAWDALKNRPAEDFGLVVTASAEGDDDRTIPVQTATLMRRWDRDADADRFDDLARAHGLLD